MIEEVFLIMTELKIRIIMNPSSGRQTMRQTVDDIVNQTVNRVLDLLDITLPEDLFRRWQGGRAAGNDR